MENDQMKIEEGYFDSTRTEPDTDCDHGPCLMRVIPSLGLVMYTYGNHPDMVSFHPMDHLDPM